VDIEEFYDADPRRRASDEVEWGSDWHDADGVRFELSWVADTGELYAMRMPMEPIDYDPAFGSSMVEPLDTDTVTVEILGTFTERGEVESRLSGWQDEMLKENSLVWARERLRS